MLPQHPRTIRRGRQSRPSLVGEFRRIWLVSLIGMALMFGSVSLMMYNEHKAVQREQSLLEAEKQLIRPESNSVIFDENEQKLLFVSDKLRVEQRLQDEMHGVSVAAVRLERIVYMYQWVEIERRVEVAAGADQGDHDGLVDVDYSYDTDWVDHPVDSRAFNIPMGHENPPNFPINSTVWVNEAVYLGGFALGSESKALVRWSSVVTGDERPADSGIRMHAGLYYHAKDLFKPEVGDLRVHFAVAGKDGEHITVVGKQENGVLRPFQTNNGQELLIVRKGEQSVESVFSKEHDQNRLQTWITRLAAWLMLFLGLNCNHSPLNLLVSEYGWVRPLVPVTTFSLPFSFSVTITLFVTGLSWCLFRPILASFLFLIALLPCLKSLLILIFRKWQDGFGSVRMRRNQLF